MGHQRDYSEQVAGGRRRGGPQARRRRARRGVARRQRQPRPPRPPRPRAAREGDPQRGRARRAVRRHRQAPGPPDVAVERAPHPVRPRAGPDPGRAAAALNGSNGSGAPAGATVTPGDPEVQAEIDAAARGRRRPRRASTRRPRSSRCRMVVVSSPDDEELDATGPTGHVDIPRAEAAVRELLLAIGEDPDREGLRRHAPTGREGRARAVRRDVAGPEPTCSSEDVLDRPLRARHRPRHPDVLHVRAPPAALPRRGAHRLHPRRRRPGHRPEQARPARRGLRPPARRCRSRSRRRSPTRSSSTSGSRASSSSSRPSTCACRCAACRSRVAVTITSAVRGQLRDAATRAEAMALLLGGKR